MVKMDCQESEKSVGDRYWGDCSQVRSNQILARINKRAKVRAEEHNPVEVKADSNEYNFNNSTEFCNVEKNEKLSRIDGSELFEETKSEIRVEEEKQNGDNRYWGAATRVRSLQLLAEINARTKHKGSAKLGRDLEVNKDDSFEEVNLINSRSSLNMKAHEQQSSIEPHPKTCKEPKLEPKLNISAHSSNVQEMKTQIEDKNQSLLEAETLGTIKTPKKRLLASEDGDTISKKVKFEEENLVSNQSIKKRDENNQTDPIVKTVPDKINDDIAVNTNQENNKKKKRRRSRKKKTNEVDKEVGGFTVLSDVLAVKTEKVARVLPHWLKNPVLVGHSLSEDIKSMEDTHELSPATREKLKQTGIKSLFPIQQEVIPTIVNGNILCARYRPRDICVSAPTGSGKTLTFVLPIIEVLQKRVVPRIRALVLLPVQELARQIYKVFKTYGEHLGLKVGLAVGQKSFVKEQASLVFEDYNGYHSAIDILVATPGRLSDHLTKTPGFTLSHLRFLVLDEADKLLSGEAGESVANIERVINQSLLPRPESMGNMPAFNCPFHGGFTLPSEPLQRLLFSATLSHDPEQLQHITLYRPKLFTVVAAKKGETTKESSTIMVGQYTRPAELTEQFAIVSSALKPLIVHHLIASKQWKKTIVFTNSREATHKLALLLQAMSHDLYQVEEFSSDKGSQRSQIVSQFTSGKIDVLVSSDAIARGLDVPGIEHVVSYNITSLSTYIHRIGRTARAGNLGTALSLVTDDEVRDFKKMMTGASTISELSIPESDLATYETLYIESISKMKSKVAEEKKNNKIVLDIRNKNKSKNIKVLGGKTLKSKRHFVTGSNKIKLGINVK